MSMFKDTTGMNTENKRMEAVSLFKTTEEVYQKATELTNLPIRIASHKTLQMQGMVIHATPDDPVYRVYYYAELDEGEANATITHELCHIVRTLRVPQDEPLTVRKRPTQAVLENYRTYDIVGTSLFSYPDDLEIEKFIATRSDLKAGQKRYWKPVVEGFGREIEDDFRTLPQRLFQVEHSLDYVLMRRVGELLGEKMTRHYYGYKDVMEEGKVLLEIADSIKRQDVAGDREVTRLWIERLRVGEVFSLVPLAAAEFSDKELNFLLSTNPNAEVYVFD
jgi:hypothetical protein